MPWVRTNAAAKLSTPCLKRKAALLLSPPTPRAARSILCSEGTALGFPRAKKKECIYEADRLVVVF